MDNNIPNAGINKSIANPRSPSTVCDILRGASAGVPLGCFAYLIAIVGVMASVPLRPEGIRNVVDIPWRMYSFLPSGISFFALMVIWIVAGWTNRNRTIRISLLIAAGIAIVIATANGLSLLSRDFRGKF